MTIKITSEQELVDLSKELLNALYNLRYWTKRWESEYGVDTKDAKKRWEKKADDILEKLEMQKTDQAKEIKISVAHKTETNASHNS